MWAKAKALWGVVPAQLSSARLSWLCRLASSVCGVAGGASLVMAVEGGIPRGVRSFASLGGTCFRLFRRTPKSSRPDVGLRVLAATSSVTPPSRPRVVAAAAAAAAAALTVCASGLPVVLYAGHGADCTRRSWTRYRQNNY